MIKNPVNLLFLIFFRKKFLHLTINLLFCVVFAYIKLPRQDIPKNNYCLNDTIIFLLSCCVVGQKKCYRRPLVPSTEWIKNESTDWIKNESAKFRQGAWKWQLRKGFPKMTQVRLSKVLIGLFSWKRPIWHYRLGAGAGPRPN